MKRLFALSMVITLLAAFIIPVQSMAQENKELESAISTAKSILDIKDTYDTFSYNMSKQSDTTVYQLNWSDSKNKLGNVNVSIDTDGKIINYYAYKPYDSSSNRSKIPSVSKADAIKTANDFIKKVNPYIWNYLSYQQDTTLMNINDTSYHFDYRREQNGIPLLGNVVNVSVDNRTGQVVNYSCSWTDNANFPDAGGVIGVEKAKQSYMDKLGWKLVYKTDYRHEDAAPYLAYTNVYNGRSIDAKTGEIMSTSDYYHDGMAKREASQSGAMNTGKGDNETLSPEERKAVEKSASFVNQEKAEEIARKTLSLDSGYSLASINLYNSWRNKTDYIWSMNFNKEEKNGEEQRYYSASVTIDAVNGDIISFYRSLPYEKDSKPKYNKDQSLKIASDFIKSLQPVKSNEVEYVTWGEPEVRPLMESSELPAQYSFTFTRKANIAYFPGDGFNVTVDTTKGFISNYNFTWYKGQLPSTASAISPAEAHNILFDKIGMELQYTPYYSPEPEVKMRPMPETSKNPELKLVYNLKQGKAVNIDANTGKLLDYSGAPYEDLNLPEYNDIKGISAENQINLLAEYGIFLPGNQFKPDQAVTQKEFLYLLEKATSPYIDYRITDDSKYDDSLYNYLAGSNIVKEGEKSPNSNVSKQDAAKFIVRSLNYDKIAELKGIFNVPFKDGSSIDSKLYGYVAIAYGLNIIKDDGGNFSPTGNMTRDQAVTAIYNLLNIN